MSWDTDVLQAELAAEMRGAERLEYLGDGYQFRRLGRLSNEDIERLAAVVRAVRWNREHPERRREIANAYARKPEARARANELARQRRARKPRPVLACLECGARFVKRGRPGGTVPEFCRDACRQRYRYQQRTPGARRTKRRTQ